jgi:hypothetical protein
MSFIDFSIHALDSTFQLSTLGTLDSVVLTPSASDATAVFYVKLSDMANIFKFQTDSTDMTDTTANDIRYYVFRKNWPSNLKLNPAHAMLDKTESDGRLGMNVTYASTKSLVKHDFIRYLAYRLFNTIHGVDLFNNESDLLENLTYYGEVTRCGIEAILDSISTTSASPTMSIDASGNKYLTNDDSSSTNICRELLRQVSGSQPIRLTTIADRSDIQSIPFAENDSLNIKLTISPAANQHSLTNVSPITDRIYNIKLVLKTDISGTNTAIVDSTMYPNSFPYSSNVTSVPAATPAVYADASPPQVIPSTRLGYNGWYYTNSDSWVNVAPSVRNKINWYFGPNISTSTVGDIRYIRLNLRVFNRTSLPFIAIYTKATGSGDTGGWYKSKKVYIISNSGSLTNGTNYCAYLNMNSYTTAPAVIGHTNAAMSVSTITSSNVGVYATTEVLYAIAINTDSGSARGNVEFTLSSLIIGDASGEKEYGFIGP